MDVNKKDFGKITDEALADLRGRIGQELPIKQWNHVATRDAIWHFAEGLGDDNPLWRDEEYASKTRYASIVAPPAFLYSCNSAGGGGGFGLPGVYGLHAKDEWVWYQPVHENDRIEGNQKLVHADWKNSKFSGRMIEQVSEITYWNQRKELLAQCWVTEMRMERHRAREKGKEISTFRRYRYTDEELELIEEAYKREEVQRCGSKPRYWEDVKEGEKLSPLVKGPVTVTSMVTWLMGWGSPLCKTDRIAHAYMRKHPGARIMHPVTNTPDFAEGAHWDEELARHSGSAAGYDIGAQRISWFSHMMTDWIGDEGFLQRLEVQLRAPNYVGNTTWLRGKVIRKRQEAGLFLVDCEMWGDDQVGRRHALAWATAALPLKVHGPLVLPPVPKVP